MASRSGISFNGKVDTHKDITERVHDGGRDRRSIKESCANNTIIKALRQLREEVERRTTDPLQGPPVHQSYEIKTDDRELQERSERPV